MKVADLKYLLVIAGLVIVIILMRTCTGFNTGGNLPPGLISSDTVRVYQTDTLTLLDTVWPAPDTVLIAAKPIPTPTVDPIDTTVSVYADSLSTQDVTIFYRLRTRGVLLGAEHSYVLKVPLTVKETVTVTNNTTTTITNKQLVSGLFVGGRIGYSPTTGRAALAFGADFVAKQGFSIGYDYDILNNGHSIGYRVLIFPRKKNR